MFAFCLDDPPMTSSDDPATLVELGYLAEAWVRAARAPEWNATAMMWLVGNIFARMQTLIRNDVIPNQARWGVDGAKSAAKLADVSRRTIDGLKQWVWDHFPS